MAEPSTCTLPAITLPGRGERMIMLVVDGVLVTIGTEVGGSIDVGGILVRNGGKFVAVAGESVGKLAIDVGVTLPGNVFVAAGVISSGSGEPVKLHANNITESDKTTPITNQ